MMIVNAALRRSLYAPVLLLLLALGACASPPKKAVTAADAFIVAPTPVAAPAVPPTVVASPLPEAPTPFDLGREDIRAFIDEISTKNSIPVADIRALLAQGMHQPRIIAAITRPAENVLRWFEYSNRLVSAERIARGVEFALGQSARLEAVHAKTGVSPAYIVAIIGIETNYGRNKGTWRVLDALMTLGFNYPPRSRFFRTELEQFLLLVREEKLDPLATLGSYAGAMGAPQFMPSSYRRYAVNGALDGESNARRDLFDNWDDVIGSVANYLMEHGWQREQTAIIDAEANADTMATVIPTLDRRNLELNETAVGARARGFVLPESISDDTRVILIPAELVDRANVRIGLRNFYVITRYNRSILYAMAAHDLATAIAAELAKPAPLAISTTR